MPKNYDNKGETTGLDIITYFVIFVLVLTLAFIVLPLFFEGIAKQLHSLYPAIR